jgi:hypothetical protein
MSPEVHPCWCTDLGCLLFVVYFIQKAQMNDLDRMQSSLQKQIEYNQRIMEAEAGIAGINCDLPRFLWEMKFTDEEQVVICVNGSESMKRNEEQIAGQIWIQGDRQMAASNKVLDGMANTRESAVLPAVVEEVSWQHAGEPAGRRKGQRGIVYPKDISQLPAVLSTRNPNIDNEDGHPIAYQAILQHSDGYEKPPVFLRDDSEPVISDPVMSGRVPEWMASAEQMATGEDKMNSSDEDDPKMKPDELTGTYTSEMDPKAGPRKLSQAEAAHQRAAAQAIRAAGFPDPVKSYRLSTDAYSLPSSEPANAVSALPASESQRADKSATRLRAVADSAPPPNAPKAAAPPRAPADNPTKREQASKQPTKGQESPVAKATHPMATHTRTAS